MKYTFILLLALFGGQLIAQTKIEFNISDYPSDTLIIGYYYGDRTLVADTLIKKKNRFLFKSDTLVDPGTYIALFKPDNTYIQFLVPKDDQKFDVDYTFNQPGNPVFKGSKENKIFVDYLNLLQSLHPERQIYVDSLETNPNDSTLVAKIEALNQRVSDEQERIIKDHPKSISAALIKASHQIDVPEYTEITDIDERKIARYHYYKDHFFDHVDLAKPENMRAPFYHEKIKNYIDKLVPQHPDSISYAIDKLLIKMEPNPEAFRFYLSHFLNKYANSNIIGFDAIYVHLSKKYYAKGKATWVTPEQLGKIIANAEQLDDILIGKIAPNITLYKRDDTAVNIHDVQADYTVLIFWAPSCPHCKKSLPALKKFYNKYKPQGVEVLAVCTKHRDKVKDCWDMIEEKELTWINVVDTYHRSNFREIYNIKTTPRVFILDAEKRIVLKRVPMEKLDEIMAEIIDKNNKHIDKERR